MNRNLLKLPLIAALVAEIFAIGVANAASVTNDPFDPAQRITPAPARQVATQPTVQQPQAMTPQAVQLTQQPSPAPVAVAPLQPQAVQQPARVMSQPQVPTGKPQVSQVAPPVQQPVQVAQVEKAPEKKGGQLVVPTSKDETEYQPGMQLEPQRVVKGTQGQQQNGQSVRMPPLPVVDMTPQMIRKDAYEYNLEQMFPMDREMIRHFRRYVDEQQRAKSETVGPPPKAENRTVVLRGEPGETPAVIRLSRNFVTTLVFSDATGAPWPVKSYGTGNDEQIFAASPDPATAPNVLTLSTSASYVLGNIQVILAGRPTPIVITVVSDQKAVDYTTNIKIQSRGPNAVAPVMSSENYSVQINPKMINILDGVPPGNAVQMLTSDSRMQVWSMDGKYYVRTKMTMYSPAWTNHMASPDGIHAYEITPTPVVVAADNGNPQQVSIGD